MSMRDPQPLTANVFEILLTLADGDKHGYVIMQEVEERTRGRIKLLPGTLYRAFHRLIESDLIEETEERPAPDLDDQRRRYYRLTDRGRAVLTAEAERLADTVEAARARHVIRARGGA